MRVEMMRKEEIGKHEMRRSHKRQDDEKMGGGKKEELRPERRAVTKRDKIKTQEKQLDEKIRDEK